MIKTIESKFVYCILSKNGEFHGAYCRDYRTEYEFSSIEQARKSNVHGIFTDKIEYKIAKYRVDYTLIEENCD